MSKSWQFLDAVVLAAVLVSGRAEAAIKSEQPSTEVVSACTMAVPATRTTIEVEMPNAGDFCELVSQALGAEVFHTSLVVTPGHLWHYSDAAISCRLRFRRTADQITIHNSPSACRWFKKHATGWRPDRNERNRVA